MIPDPIFDIRNVRHCHQGQPVLEMDHLVIQPQSIIGLIGPNGSGKTTLLNLLAGVDTPTSGCIRFKGGILAPFADATRFQISLLPQEPYLLKRKVYHNVAYGLMLRKQYRNQAVKVYEALELVGLDSEDFCSRPWHALSGGESRRVALAARLVLRPEVLLLDEPTAGVDSASIQRIKEAVLSARAEWGATMIIASHDWEWLEQVCDHVLHLYKGRILGEGRVNMLFGPWRSRGDGLHEKPLRDGQLFIVSSPPKRDACALVEHGALQVHGLQPVNAEGRHVLEALILNLTLERSSGCLLLWATVGNLDLYARIPPQSPGLHLLPGKTVWLSYDPQTVKWL